MWRQQVLSPVPGQECHSPAMDLRQRNPVARRAMQRLHLHFLHLVEEGIEPGTPEDPDLAQDIVTPVNRR